MQWSTVQFIQILTGQNKRFTGQEQLKIKGNSYEQLKVPWRALTTEAESFKLRMNLRVGF